MAGDLPWLKVRGKKLYIQAMLPPKPGSGKLQPHRQMLSTGLPDTAPGRRKYLTLVTKLQRELEDETFSWDRWLPQKVVDAATAVEKLRRKKTAEGMSELTWANHLRVLEKLPEGSLTPKRMVVPLEAWKPHQGRYKQAFWILSELGKMVWGSDFKLEAPAPTYAHSKIKPREIPLDEEIETVLDGMRPHHQWMLGTIATYGIRPSELFNSELEGERLRVWETSKTGERLVYAVPSRWVEQWSLLEPRWPKKWPDLRTMEGRQQWLDQKGQRWKDAETVGNARWTYLIQNMVKGKKFPWTLYALRHAYALRCMRAGIPTTIAARMMGHTESIHIQTYKRWLSEKMVEEFMTSL